jgi:mono/diheme cytochrome c family protein
MILSEKSAIPAFARASFFGIMRWILFSFAHDLVRKVCNFSGSCAKGHMMKSSHYGIRCRRAGRKRGRAQRGVVILAAAAPLMFAAATASAQDAARLAAGEAAWDKAGCIQCHGASGEGGAGAEFPAGPSLRTTRLDRTALAETIACGLPGTPMPAWLDGAYTKRPCYGFPVGPAPDGAAGAAGVVLTPVLSDADIEALVDYLTAKFIGK